MFEKIFTEIKNLDRYISIAFLFLTIGGFIIFASASLGILAKSDIKFYAMIQSQLIGIGLGLFFAMLIGYFLPYNFYYRFAPYLYGLALIFTSLVFIPSLNLYHGGAHRWIVIGGLSIQPSELLKFAAVIMTAWLIKNYSKKFGNIKYSLVAFCLILLPALVIMLNQPDNGTLSIILGSCFIIYFLGGAKWRDIAIMITMGILGIAAILYIKPYAMDRITTFLHRENDKLGTGYHTDQSLIAVGNGGILGRGLGQSIQKFNYLPEPSGDSVYAVASEELGFLGSVFIISLFSVIIFRSFFIALFKKESFGRSIIIGIASILFIQMALNIGSMIGVVPLTGVPLPFISQGGTAILASTYLIGVLLQLTRKEI